MVESQMTKALRLF